MADRISRAFQSQRSGDVQSARETFESILQEEPENVNALQLLGLIYLNSGRLAEAEQLLSRALALRPDVAELHNNRGLCLFQGKKSLEAAADFREAIKLRPEYPEALNNLGLVLRSLGQLEEAEVVIIRAIRSRPDFAAAYCNLAMAALQQRRPDRAEAVARRALTLQPALTDAEVILGLALEQQRQLDAAETAFRNVLAHKQHWLAWLGLGRILRTTGRITEAEPAHRAALQLAPGAIDALQELGFTLLELGQLAEAEAVARKALEINAESAETYRLLGGISRERGDLAAAESHWVQAIQKDRNLAQAHCDLALLHLLTGRWKTGWAGWEWRWRSTTAASAPTEQAMWDGSPLDGKVILLWAENDVADAVMFVRYARLVQAQGGRVILRGPASLTPLFRSGLLAIERVVTEGEPLPAFDTHAPLSSLPRLLGTTPASVPCDVPYFSYLDLDAAAWMFWRDRLDHFPGQRIGLVWQSDHKAAVSQSIPSTALAALGSVPGVSLIGLHKAALAQGQPDFIRDLGIAFQDAGFMDLAAIVAGLDLLICCDCTLAHLAGALGVPVWLALPQVPRWHWQLNRDDSPWYPSLKIFRQPAPGDWTSVLSRMTEELKKWSLLQDARTAQKRRQQMNEFEFIGGIDLDPF